jgi:hypothetical protein
MYQEVHIDTQMNLNEGRLLFDGKTELTYSSDSRKIFTIMSRLEDISNTFSAKKSIALHLQSATHTQVLMFRFHLNLANQMRELLEVSV